MSRFLSREITRDPSRGLTQQEFAHGSPGTINKDKYKIGPIE